MLGSLADALVAARQHMVCLDVNGLDARIAEQESLCQQVRELDGQLDQLQAQCATKLDRTEAQACTADKQEFAAHLQEARDRMKSAQERVKQLNERHRALLRRCRRTANALLNSYAMFAGTYADPARARGVFSESAAGNAQGYSRGRG